jgi:hypothetical protein
MINMTPLLEGLRQLANKEHQQALWLDGENKQMSSFTEAMSYVFDDSGFTRAEQSGHLQANFSPEVCSKLTELRRLMHQIPEMTDPEKIIEHPNMAKIGPLAAELLNVLST